MCNYKQVCIFAYNAIIELAIAFWKFAGAVALTLLQQAMSVEVVQLAE